MNMRLLETLSRGKMEISCNLEKCRGIVICVCVCGGGRTMHHVLEFYKNMELDQGAACYLIDLQKAINLTSLILLFLHLLAESLSLALLNGVRGLKRPTPPPIRLPHIITGVATL